MAQYYFSIFSNLGLFKSMWS